MYNKPSWLKVKSIMSGEYLSTLDIVKKNNLHTICESASCPNIGECWSKGHATFLVMGNICTRHCRFCDVPKGIPGQLDQLEPDHIASAVKKMKLKHVVITSVDRDDLKDGGAGHFVKIILKIQKYSPGTTIELLTPDFLRKDESLTLQTLAMVDFAIFGHNIETVPSLYKKIRPISKYDQSLHILKQMKKLRPDIFTKSAIMLGLGETHEEVVQVLKDLRDNNVDFAVINQYLRPSEKHAEVKRYITPEEFNEYKRIAEDMGFLAVRSSPLTRSSHAAGDDYEILRKKTSKL